MRESNSELEKQSGFRGWWLHVLAYAQNDRFSPRLHHSSISPFYETSPSDFIKMIAAYRKMQLSKNFIQACVLKQQECISK